MSFVGLFACCSVVHVMPWLSVRTIADTLVPRQVSERTLALARHYVDEIVLVEDKQMLAAMRWLCVEYNQPMEPAGGAVVATVLNGLIDLRHITCPAALICGDNAAVTSVFEV